MYISILIISKFYKIILKKYQQESFRNPSYRMKGMTEKDERIKDAFHLCRWTNSSAGGSTLYITSHIIGSTNFYEQTNIRPNVFISYFNAVLQKSYVLENLLLLQYSVGLLQLSEI